MALNSVDTRPVSTGALTVIVNVDDLTNNVFGKNVLPTIPGPYLMYNVFGSDDGPGLGDFPFAPGGISGMPYDLANFLTLPSIVNSISAQSTVLSGSNTITLYVSGGNWTPKPPTVISQPADITVTLGNLANIAVLTDSVSGTSYQWYKMPAGGSWSAISGATNFYYSPTSAISGAISGDNGSSYYCNIANGYGNITSNPITMTVTTENVNLSIVRQPITYTTYVGRTANFFAQIIGTPYPNLIWWQRSNDNGVTWNTITNANSFNYNFTTVLGDNNSKYRCIVGIVSPYTVNLIDWIQAPNFIIYPT